VIVVAAGAGRRAGADRPKQFRELGGVPMVLRALRPFTAHPAVGHTVLVVPQEVASNPPAWLAELAGGGLTLIAGGATRADSVRAGLGALPAEVAIVVVHDGARPFPSSPVIDAVIAEARSGVGAVAAVPLSDTLKETDPADPRRIVRTVRRDNLWRAQTPQAFPRAVLARAFAAAATGRDSATDDAMLVEALGVPVVVVEDSTRNLKVTTAEDFALAERMTEPAR